jgi:hypothetical protein
MIFMSITMPAKVKDIEELLDQMTYDGTNATATEIYWKLQEEHKQLVGDFYLTGEVKDICNAIYEGFSEARKELPK